MTWEQRLGPAAYTAPDGTRMEFTYEDVSRANEKKTAAFDFTDGNGTFVQTNGRTGYKFPLRCIFYGENCDIDASAFEALLNQNGIGRLEHPLYGTFNAVPFGEILREDALKSAANQSIITVTFFESIIEIYPSSQIDPESSVVVSVADFCESSSVEYEEVFENASVVEVVENKGRFQNLLDSVSETLETIASAEKEVYDRFSAINTSINSAIDVLVDDPLTLAFQTIQLLQAPARAEQSITARLEAYGNLARNLYGQVVDIGDYYNRRLFGSSLLTGSIISVINHQFLTKKDALEAADVILTQFEEFTTWSDEQLDNLSLIDTGSAYADLQQSIALAAGYLIQISFTLRKEHKIILLRNRTTVDLVSELYGSVDDYLDFFIDSNRLTGSELIEIEKGREIVYYR